MVRGSPRSWQNPGFFGDRICLLLHLALVLTIAGGPWSGQTMLWLGPGPDLAKMEGLVLASLSWPWSGLQQLTVPWRSLISDQV